MPQQFHGPWKGESKILLSIDIGLAHSSVAFACLENGASQTIHPVTKWPGQGMLNMEGLIPTLVWYDASNEAVAFGAEARLHHIEDQAENNNWFLAKNFKAQLYPEDTGTQHNPRISALPFGVSLRQVYTDFLGYLLKHIQAYFEDRFIDGAQIWKRYHSTIEVIMSHPNGWGAREQSFLRDVVVRAGYTTSDLAISNIRFVTDTDAAAYCYLFNTRLTGGLQTGDVFLLCDAGNTITSVSLHRVDSTSPILKLNTCGSERLEGGASLVDDAVERYMRQQMISAGISTEDADDFTRVGIEDFKKHVKFAFGDETKEYLVQISKMPFNDLALSTRRGCMVFPGLVVRSFFEGYYSVVRQTIDRQTGAGTNISYILIAGHMGENSYLQRMIKESYGNEGCRVILAGDSTSRAVVDGGLICDINMNCGHRTYQSVYVETSNGGWRESISKEAVVEPSTEVKEPTSLEYPTPDQICPLELPCTAATHLVYPETPLPSSRCSKGHHFCCLGPRMNSQISSSSALGRFGGPWEGETKIVLGIDIGTTRSSVAFAFLQKGENQVIHHVTKWLGREAQAYDKVPTLIWYDTNQRAVSFGAEAQLYNTEEQAENNGWFLAKHFKLRLYPDKIKTRYNLKINDLPPGVSLEQIYSDFLGYLLEYTRTHFEDHILDGKDIWQKFSPEMEVVLAHPNGWGIREQAFLRSAVIRAGLLTTDRALSQVRFVAEAEASVHFCIHHANLGSRLQPGTNVLVCDAGGSTVDTTLYSVILRGSTLELEEKRESTCVLAGAIFVDFEAEKFLRNHLAGTGLNEEDIAEYVKAGVKDFESFAKRVFDNETAQQSIVIGARFTNTAIGIRRGRMIIPGPIIKGFFDVCIKDITRSVDEQLAGLNIPGPNILYILLVGGFGDSPYLRQEFTKRYESQKCSLVATNDSTSKAVADGAVLWYTAQRVVSRRPRHSFGIETLVAYDHNDPDHQGRKGLSCTLACATVPGRWNNLVRKGVPLDAGTIVRIPFFLDFSTPRPDPGRFELDLYTYSGDDEPMWMRNKQGKLLPEFRRAASIQTEFAFGRAESKLNSTGVRYWRLGFEVCIRFSYTELEAFLEWEERGCTLRGPCTMVPVLDEA